MHGVRVHRKGYGVTTDLINQVKVSKRKKMMEIGNLPPLPNNQQDFVELIANGVSPIEAYRAVQTQYSPNCKHNTGNVSYSATRMLKHPGVQTWLRAMREAGCENGIITIQNHISELERLKNLCIENKNFGAAVRAEELRGKTAGLYVDRIDITQRTDSTDLLERVGKMFGEDFKKVASEKLGIVDVTPVSAPVVTYKEVDTVVLYDAAKEQADKGANKPVRQGFQKLKGELEKDYKEASQGTLDDIRKLIQERNAKDV